MVLDLARVAVFMQSTVDVGGAAVDNGRLISAQTS